MVVSTVLICVQCYRGNRYFNAPIAAPSGKEWISIFIQTNVKIKFSQVCARNKWAGNMLMFHVDFNMKPKPLEGMPATISRKSVMAKANTSSLAVRGKGDQRPFYFNICQWRRGFTTQNKQLFRGNGLSFNESTAYLLIFNMFYTKNSSIQKYCLEFTTKKSRFIREVTDILRQVGFRLRHFSFIPMVSVNGDWVSHNSDWNSMTSRL